MVESCKTLTDNISMALLKKYERKFNKIIILKKCPNLVENDLFRQPRLILRKFFHNWQHQCISHHLYWNLTFHRLTARRKRI